METWDWSRRFSRGILKSRYCSNDPFAWSRGSVTRIGSEWKGGASVKGEYLDASTHHRQNSARPADGCFGLDSTSPTRDVIKKQTLQMKMPILFFSAIILPLNYLPEQMHAVSSQLALCPVFSQPASLSNNYHRSMSFAKMNTWIPCRFYHFCSRRADFGAACRWLDSK